MGGSVVALFDPKGAVAGQQTWLIEESVLLMLVIVVPMFVFLFTIAWKYRAGNNDASYDPDRKHTVWNELVLWALPAVIIVGLSVPAWRATHAVDPYQPIASDAESMTIQVVALPWKWLFIYPAQNIATINYVAFPEKTPIRFELTADGPMSSFWIPQLGSQMYAMAAMQTQLNLIASSTGNFRGKDMEINGDGYAGMTFMAQSLSQSDFDAWVASVKQATSSLGTKEYQALAAPSENNPQAVYASIDPSLYTNIMMQYMAPQPSGLDEHHHD